MPFLLSRYYWFLLFSYLVSTEAKKAAILLVSWQPVIGRGTSKTAARVKEDVQDLHQRGVPEITRHLTFGGMRRFTLRRATCLTSWSIWCKTCTLRWCGVFVHFDGQPICLRLAAVSCKGDWPGLCDAGALTVLSHSAQETKCEKSTARDLSLVHGWLSRRPLLWLPSWSKVDIHYAQRCCLSCLGNGNGYTSQVSQQGDTSQTYSTTGIWTLARTFVLPPWWCFCCCAMVPLWWRSLKRWPAFGDPTAGLGALEGIYFGPGSRWFLTLGVFCGWAFGKEKRTREESSLKLLSLYVHASCNPHTEDNATPRGQLVWRLPCARPAL